VILVAGSEMEKCFFFDFAGQLTTFSKSVDCPDQMACLIASYSKPRKDLALGGCA
jgi:hypothetical protein